MLSGIRTGKKKTKTATPANTAATTSTASDIDSPDASQTRIQQQRATHTHPSTSTTSGENNNNNNNNNNNSSRSNSKDEHNDSANLSAAERFKQALAAGTSLADLSSSTVTSSSSHLDRITSKLVTTTSRRLPGSSDRSNEEEDDHDNLIVVDTPAFLTGRQEVGQGTRTTAPSSWRNKREEDMTMAELAAKERATSSSSGGGAAPSSSTTMMMSWDEHMTRDIIRVGKKRKIKAGGRNTTKYEDSDDEVERMKRHLPDYQDNDTGESDRKLATKFDKANRRNQRRQIDQFQKQERITSMCGWWINSSSFTKHRLLAFGKHVSLMMAPPTASLIPGGQFYLVPLKHATSFVDCDDDGGVWDEVAMFRSSLENVFARDRKGIIFLETVLPDKGFWQTKIEVIPVPFAALQDAPMYFKSAMIEQAEDFGTHNKLMVTTVQKPLRNVIPKRFPYFAVDWGNISTSDNTGYAQIIESSTFRHDFGIDTIAGMIGHDPVRFQRKLKFTIDVEMKWINEFVSKWQPFDWTENL
jgi:hypothetical protein